MKEVSTPFPRSPEALYTPLCCSSQQFVKIGRLYFYLRENGIWSDVSKIHFINDELFVIELRRVLFHNVVQLSMDQVF